MPTSSRNRKRWDVNVVALAPSARTAACGNSSFFDQKCLQNSIYDEGLQSLSTAHPAF